MYVYSVINATYIGPPGKVAQESSYAHIIDIQAKRPGNYSVRYIEASLCSRKLRTLTEAVYT